MFGKTQARLDIFQEMIFTIFMGIFSWRENNVAYVLAAFGTQFDTNLN